ncbi:MAG: hypothetical protein WAS72_13015 [Saprospiraceae bacterium]
MTITYLAFVSMADNVGLSYILSRINFSGVLTVLLHYPTSAPSAKPLVLI